MHEISNKHWSISFWKDPWSKGERLTDNVGIASIQYSINTPINDFIMDGTWNFPNAANSQIEAPFQDIKQDGYPLSGMRKGKQGLPDIGSTLHCTYSSARNIIRSPWPAVEWHNIVWYTKNIPKPIIVYSESFLIVLKQEIGLLVLA